jgi:hypothetical protein
MSSSQNNTLHGISSVLSKSLVSSTHTPLESIMSGGLSLKERRIIRVLEIPMNWDNHDFKVSDMQRELHDRNVAYGKREAKPSLSEKLRRECERQIRHLPGELARLRGKQIVLLDSGGGSYKKGYTKKALVERLKSRGLKVSGAKYELILKRLIAVLEEEKKALEFTVGAQRSKRPTNVPTYQVQVPVTPIRLPGSQVSSQNNSRDECAGTGAGYRTPSTFPSPAGSFSSPAATTKTTFIRGPHRNNFIRGPTPNFVSPPPPPPSGKTTTVSHADRAPLSSMGPPQHNIMESGSDVTPRCLKLARAHQETKSTTTTRRSSSGNSVILTEGQRRRIEANRQQALHRQAAARAKSPPRHRVAESSAPPSTSSPQELTPMQKFRIEMNRLHALHSQKERAKQQQQQQNAPAPRAIGAAAANGSTHSTWEDRQDRNSTRQEGQS